MLRGSFRNDIAPAGAAVGSQVDDPVGRLDDVEVVLDHDDRVSLCRKAVEDLQQLANVVKMQTGGRLIEDVERLTGPLLDQLASQLDSLRFAAGKRWGRLTQLDVVEPDVMQGLEHRGDLGDICKMVEGLLHVHVEDIADALALEPDVESLAAEALALTDETWHPDIGQKIHLQAIGAVAVTGLAAPTRDVEAESARQIAAGLRLGQLGVKITDQVEQLDVGRRVGARGAADRRLIDVDDFVEVLKTNDAVVNARLRDGSVQVTRRRLAQDVPDQGALARPGYAGHADKKPERKGRVDGLEVVMASSLDRQESPVGGLAPWGMAIACLPTR